MGASLSSGSSAGRCVHFFSVALSARLAFVRRSSEFDSCMKLAKSTRSTSPSARARAWSGLCRPTCPSDHAAAALMWSAVSLMSASLSGAMPLETMTARASVSENAAMYLGEREGER